MENYDIIEKMVGNIRTGDKLLHEFRGGKDYCYIEEKEEMEKVCEIRNTWHQREDVIMRSCNVSLVKDGRWSSRDGRWGKERPLTPIQRLLYMLSTGQCGEHIDEKCNFCPKKREVWGSRRWARNQGRKAGDEEPQEVQVCWREGKRKGRYGVHNGRRNLELSVTWWICASDPSIWQRRVKWTGRRRAWSWGDCWLNPGKNHEDLKEKERLLTTRGSKFMALHSPEDNPTMQQESC